ncbi:DUF3231 family protein [Virgibacillus necropolis]|uniref:DUF3231 family protein n=1 Tax=Virgibacillus necropolis TaxID=163877 RepID=UPI00384CB753
MENTEHNHVQLTSSEISSLWGSYQVDTMMICGIKYFLSNIEDTQIQSVLELALSLTQKHNDETTSLFINENYPVPQGFTDKDVNLDAPRLFTDKLYLDFILSMSKFTLLARGLALSLSERKDVIDYYTRTLSDAQELHKNTMELAKEKGIYIRSPHIPKPDQIDFVNNRSYLAGWFGERRPLLGIEISHLVYNANRNALGQAIITGFSQVANLKEVRQFFERGREISGKHQEIFTAILHESYLSNGIILTSEVTNSTKAPFSDKLMMFLITTLIGFGIGQYGLSMSSSPRHDLGMKYTRLMAEIAKYSNDGAKIMIDNNWMEQPPIAADRKELAK